MHYFFMGFFGAVACLVMFGAGFVVGWGLCRLTRRHRVKPPRHETRPEPVPEPQPDALRAEQDAFRRLQNYTVEDAYGRNPQDVTPLT